MKNILFILSLPLLLLVFVGPYAIGVYLTDGSFQEGWLAVDFVWCIFIVYLVEILNRRSE